MNGNPDATAIFAPIWRRKWIILIVAVLVSGATYAHYKGKPTTFSVKSQLYLGAGSEGQALLNNTLGKTTLSATAIANQVALINSTIGEQVHRQFRRAHNLLAAKAKVKAKAAASSDFIQLTGEGQTATATAEAVNAYAQTYIKRHQANYEKAVDGAIETTKKQILRIERAEALAKSKKNSSSNSASTLQSAALSTKLNQLESDLAVQGVQQVGTARPAKAELIGPHPKQNAIFGFFIGLVLAAIGAFVLARANRRLRSLADVEGIFELPILTAMPAVRTPIVRRDGEVRPSKLLSEPLRRLHTTLQLAGAAPAEHGNGATRRPRTILLLSADPGDGKSTVAAGLALEERDAYERAALVEADFRRPVQSKLLGVTAQPGLQGLAQVLTGATLATGAMQRVSGGAPGAGAQAEQEQPAEGALATLVPPAAGSVSVLLGSTDVANPPALLGRPEMAELLRGLAGEYDSVIVDVPSPLQVSDAMPLLNAVDAIVIVARIGHTRQTSAARLREMLERTPSAPLLGVVANAVPSRDIERYGLAATGTRSWLMRLFGG